MTGRSLLEVWQGMGWPWRYDDIRATGLSVDSRTVAAGQLFLAIATDINALQSNIQQAQTHHACAIAMDEDAYRQIPNQLINAYPNTRILPVAHLQQHKAALASCFFDHPSADMLLVGVTGTNGKTSVSHYLAQALNQLNTPCGVIGTTGHGLLQNLQDAANTTPDSPLVQSLLSQMQRQGASACAMEVSSHALDQQRVDCCKFDMAIFTNLSRDHLDYHETMDAYKAAKAKLFAWEHLQHAVINVDDAFAQQLVTNVKPNTRVWTYSIARQLPHVSVALLEAHYNDDGIHATLATEKGNLTIQLNLLGQFNLVNVMAVVTSLLALDYAPINIQQVVSKLIPVTGRMERFGYPDSVSVVVDYAHTPDALRAALEAARCHANDGKLWCVFGCGGGRDKGKRAEMAAMAEQFADHIVVTDDNPRQEASADIIQQIMSGFRDITNVEVVPDRAQAIAFALQKANINDLVLVAGKGHETYQDSGTQRLMFSDREQVQTRLKEKATCLSH